MRGTATNCVVCGEELTAPNVATCMSCFQEFHLQMRMDVPGKDCGQVWLNETHMHLEFGCLTCLGKAGTEREE
jgi:hypothetical protein